MNNAEGVALTAVPSAHNATNQVFENRLVWTVEDVAKELHCSSRHVRKLVSDDKIPYSKVGRLVRFSPMRLEEWLRKGGTR